MLFLISVWCYLCNETDDWLNFCRRQSLAEKKRVYQWTLFTSWMLAQKSHSWEQFDHSTFMSVVPLHFGSTLGSKDPVAAELYYKLWLPLECNIANCFYHPHIYLLYNTGHVCYIKNTCIFTPQYMVMLHLRGSNFVLWKRTLQVI